jgi:hypothetical protein
LLLLTFRRSSHHCNNLTGLGAGLRSADCNASSE